MLPSPLWGKGCFVNNSMEHFIGGASVNVLLAFSSAVLRYLRGRKRRQCGAVEGENTRIV
jgi:hypothetical protein